MSLNSNQETIHLDHQQVMDLLLPVENSTATEDVYPIHCIFQKKLSKTYVSPKRTYEKNKQNQKNVQKNQNTSLQDVSNVEKNDTDNSLLQLPNYWVLEWYYRGVELREF